MRLTEAQQRTIWLWRLNSRGSTPDAYALHESEMIHAGITESGRGARAISNGLIRRGIAADDGWDEGLFLRLTPAGLDVLDHLVGYRTQRADDDPADGSIHGRRPRVPRVRRRRSMSDRPTTRGIKRGGYTPVYPAVTVGGPATPPPAPVDRGGQPESGPVVHWVELPDALIERIYRLDLGVDDLDHRIAVLVAEAEGRQPLPAQCTYESEPDDIGLVRPCQLHDGHDGPHVTRRQEEGSDDGA